MSLGLVARSMIGRLGRQIAEGKKGVMLKRIYWKLAGWKTITSLALGALAAAAGTVPEVATYVDPEVLGTIAGVGVALGLVDKAWRARPAELPGPLKALAGASAVLGVLVVTATALVETQAPELTPWIRAVAAALSWAGMMIVAKGAEPPGR